MLATLAGLCANVCAGYTGEDGGVCEECTAGTFKPLNGSQLCDRCPFGKFSTEAGAIIPGQFWEGWCYVTEPDAILPKQVWFEEPGALLPKQVRCTDIRTGKVCGLKQVKHTFSGATARESSRHGAQ